MKRYSTELIQKVQKLRSEGKTYGEIRKETGINFPKSSIHELCKNVPLPLGHWEKISKLNISNLEKARKFAVEINSIKRLAMFEEFKKINTPISRAMANHKTAKIALAMLCLGEASKWSHKHRGFSLGNSDPRIIILFLKLLKLSFNDFNQQKIRCTVQCRADQDVSGLENYWQNLTKIPPSQFYNSRIDTRTVGKPTLKSDYKGVLRVDYFNTKTQLELESLADLIYNYVAGPVV